MLKYQLLGHGILKKQAETVHTTGKQTAYISKLYKTEFTITWHYLKSLQCGAT